jgi:hypothetical protein
VNDLLSIISALCLAIIGALCLVGVFHPRYDDTLGERLGMSLVGMWTLARLPIKVAQVFDLVDGDTEPVHLMLHIGLASFALGMAWAKWRAFKRHGGHGFQNESAGA